MAYSDRNTSVGVLNVLITLNIALSFCYAKPHQSGFPSSSLNDDPVRDIARQSRHLRINRTADPEGAAGTWDGLSLLKLSAISSGASLDDREVGVESEVALVDETVILLNDSSSSELHFIEEFVANNETENFKEFLKNNKTDTSKDRKASDEFSDALSNNSVILQPISRGLGVSASGDTGAREIGRYSSVICSVYKDCFDLPFTACIMGHCKCNSGYHWMEEWRECVALVPIGGRCRANVQCQLDPDAICIQDRCECRYRYNERVNKCVSHSSAETNRMYRMLVLTAGCGVGFILLLLITCVLKRACCSKCRRGSDSGDQCEGGVTSPGSVSAISAIIATPLDNSVGAPHRLSDADLRQIQRAGIFEKPPTYDEALKHKVAPKSCSFVTPPPPYSESLEDVHCSQPCFSGSFTSNGGSTHCLIPSAECPESRA